MKSIVLGIMIASVSVSFAQTEDIPTHQLKKRFSVKQMMVVQPDAMDIKDNSESAEKSGSVVLSRKEVKSSIANGVIRMKNGIAFIDLESNSLKRRMMPVNLPNGMAIDGQKLMFTYTISNTPIPKNSKCNFAIKIYDVSTPARK